MINHSETFTQKMIAVGIALERIARVSPKQYKACRDILLEVNELISLFRELPEKKKQRFNDLMKQEETMCKTEGCYQTFIGKKCPLCNSIDKNEERKSKNT